MHEVLTTSVKEFRILFEKEFESNQILRDIDKICDNYRFLLLKVADNPFSFNRLDMPVITDKKLESFHAYMRAQAHNQDISHLLAEDRFDIGDKELSKYTRCRIKYLFPVQKQIYVDKILANLKAVEKKNINKAIQTKFNKTVLVTNKTGYIIDGHHRWATMMVINPNYKVSIAQTDIPLRELLKVALDFDADHNIKHNK